MDFSVIGGDARQARLASQLALDGHEVRTYGLGAAPIGGAVRCAGPGEALSGGGWVVLPLPLSDGNGALNAPLGGGKFGLGELFGMLSGRTAFAGKADESAKEMARANGAVLFDYSEREEFAVRNAAITAEGAIQLLMEELPATLLGARILVVGFGRIGKALSLRLRALGADVTVSARRFSDFAWIETFGCAHSDTRRLGPELGAFDAVVNTVPMPVLDEERLGYLGKGCLCVDLASRPGGVDFEAAERLGVRAVHALSLPGRAAPESAAAAIKDTLYDIISELECTG